MYSYDLTRREFGGLGLVATGMEIDDPQYQELTGRAITVRLSSLRYIRVCAYTFRRRSAFPTPTVAAVFRPPLRVNLYTKQLRLMTRTLDHNHCACCCRLSAVVYHYVSTQRSAVGTYLGTTSTSNVWAGAHQCAELVLQEGSSLCMRQVRSGDRLPLPR